MKTFFKLCAFLFVLLALNCLILSDASAGFKITYDEKSLELYGRIQPRYEWKEVDDPADEKAHTGHDFYIRRTRIGFKAKYNDQISGKLEWKLDNYLQESKDPETKLENAFVSFDYFNEKCLVEFGLQNSVFSREGQLSDSKLLFDDRSIIVNKLASEDLADNATGLYLKGKLAQKHLEYGLGLYEGGDGGGDSSTEGDRSDSPLYAFGVVYHIFDPESRQGSHVGDGNTYLTTGAYYTCQDRENLADTETISAYGADVFAQFGAATLSAGYFLFRKDFDVAADRKNDGFYVEGAYLIPLAERGDLEFAARYQSYTPDDDFTGPDEKQSTVGINYYIKKHDIKVQGSYNINEKDEEHAYDPGDNFVLQIQLAW